jgi:hypothetical protein
MTIEKYRNAFLHTMAGVPTHHVIAAMNVATPGIEWRHCSKSHMAESYAKVMQGSRMSLSGIANDAMQAIDLEELRHAALERGRGVAGWQASIQATMHEALYGKEKKS